MLGQQTTEQGSKTYLNIKEGAIVKRTAQGEEKYTYVDGYLTSLHQKERSFRGEIVMYWYLDLRDGQSNELYSLGFPYGSNTFKSIILQLASDNGLQAIRDRSTLRIEPYRGENGYDKVQVWGEGVKLDWVTRQLPPVMETTVGGRKIKDDTERMNFICSLANKIQEQIKR